MTTARKADWHAELHEGGGFHVIARGAGHKGLDLIVCSREGNLLREAELHAFGQLIAASPDLLEAAQAAWNCIGELPPTQARVEVALLLQAAIEKAIGEQP